VAGIITEHQSLVAGTLLGRVLAVGGLGVHALGDVGRLAVDADVDLGGVGGEPDAGVHVPDVADDGPHQGVDVGAGQRRARGDFPRHADEIRRAEGFHGDAAVRIVDKAEIQDRIRDLVGNLVGMALGNGFGREQSTCHGKNSSVRRFGTTLAGNIAGDECIKI